MGNEEERLCMLTGGNIDAEPNLYNGLLPSLVPHSPPRIPPFSNFVTGIINSTDKIFITFHLLGHPNIHEWCL
jgi:hypothetical protein